MKPARLHTDPWANYVRQSGRPLDSDMPKEEAKSSASIPRVTTGPIEDRFTKQDQQIDALKTSLQAMTTRLDLQDKKHESFQQDVKLGNCHSEVRHGLTMPKVDIQFRRHSQSVVA